MNRSSEADSKRREAVGVGELLLPDRLKLWCQSLRVLTCSSTAWTTAGIYERYEWGLNLRREVHAYQSM